MKPDDLICTRCTEKHDAGTARCCNHDRPDHKRGYELVSRAMLEGRKVAA